MRDMWKSLRWTFWSEKTIWDPNKSVIYEVGTRKDFFYYYIGSRFWQSVNKISTMNQELILEKNHIRLSRCKKIMMMLQIYWGDLPWFCIEGIFCRRLDYWPNRVKSDKGGYPAAVRTLSVPAEKRGRGLTWIAHCQSGSHVHSVLLSKLGGKIVVVGIIHLGLLAFLKLRISCTFPSIFLSLWDICCTFGIYCRDFVFLPRNCRSGGTMWKRLVAGCENCWRLGRKPGDTSSDEPQTSIITWKMTQSTWSIAAEKMGTPVSSSNYQALWLKWRHTHHLNLLSFNWCKRFLFLFVKKKKIRGPKNYLHLRFSFVPRL